jgi:hypothetical protein
VDPLHWSKRGRELCWSDAVLAFYILMIVIATVGPNIVMSGELCLVQAPESRASNLA